MVPDSYHDLFVASAGVAGALIGLLFVAITVKPEEASKGSVRQRLRPAAALSAFLNALFVSLLALFPDNDMSHAFAAVALVSVAAVLGMLVFLAFELKRASRRQVLRAAFSMVVQLGTSLVQLVAAIHLTMRPEAGGSILTIAVTVLVMFSTGIDRAWEFVGAQDTGLITTLVHAVAEHQHRSEPPDGTDRPSTDDPPPDHRSTT